MQPLLHFSCTSSVSVCVMLHNHNVLIFTRDEQEEASIIQGSYGANCHYVCSTNHPQHM
jgi:hypothetical protein